MSKCNKVVVGTNLLPALLLTLLLPLTTKTFPTQNSDMLNNVNDEQLMAIQNYMNLSADPCQDFYTYACGSWSNYHDGEHYKEAGGYTDYKLNKKLVNFLENYEPTGDSSNIYNKVWTYHKSCVDTEGYEEIKYLNYLKSTEGIDWQSVLETNRTQPFDWLLLLAKLRRYGLSGVIIEQLVVVSALNASQATLQLNVATVDEESTFKLSDKADIAETLAGFGASTAVAEEIAEKVTILELALNSVLSTAMDDSVRVVNLEVLEKNIPDLAWRQYLQIILEQDFIPPDYSVQISNVKHFYILSKMMQQVDATTIFSYIMLHFLIYLFAESTTKFDEIDCMVDVRNKMELAISLIYKQQYYAAEADSYNAEVMRMFELIRHELLAKLNENRLQLSAAESDVLKFKLEKMFLVMGNLPKNADAPFIGDLYGAAHLDSANYYHNLLSMLALRNRLDFERLKHGIPKGDNYFAINHKEFSYGSIPYYSTRDNAVIVPFGFLQPPLFHSSMHDVFKMSLFGFIFGHEITHGFDREGVNLDYTGNVNEVRKAINANPHFSDSLECMLQEQTASLDERIADISGIRLAYDATFGANSTLNVQQPNFSEIPLKRLFFLNFAQFFCGNLEAADAYHDADNVRVRQILINFKPFAEAFQCQLGDAMNPEKKCRLW